MISMKGGYIPFAEVKPLSIIKFHVGGRLFMKLDDETLVTLNGNIDKGWRDPESKVFAFDTTIKWDVNDELLAKIGSA